MRLHVEGEFHAAHRLDDHPGKCAHLHGHTYFVQADVEVPDDDVFKSTSNRAVDFSEVKGVFRAHLDAADHSCWLSRPSCVLLFNHEPLTVPDGGMLKVPGASKIIVTSGEPTAEMRARIIYQWLAPDYRKLGEARGTKVHLLHVTVWETDEQGATYEPNVRGPEIRKTDDSGS
jgi:6-pyruvoyltetrahydropterin/6-carboxytetrahydropterin synthase